MTTNDGGAATAGGTRGREGRRRSKEVQLPNAVSVGQIAEMLGLNPVDVIKQFMRNGIMAAVNQFVDYEAAAMVVRDFGLEPVQAQSPQQEGVRGGRTDSYGDEDVSKLQHRPPVVTILGHVDHGKTTLLDAIRNTNVVDSEAGGITQHIGAYQVSHGDNVVTFLDTPGHEAFTEMRARGARVTDVAVLVVAADDGVMPQTVEAINHVKAAAVPIIVAINKVDRHNADPERVKRQLSEHDLIVEDWGGDVISVPVSALRKDGIDDLLDNILVASEVAELKANPNREARGVVVEASMDRSRGPVATVLVQTGTLETGNIVVAGSARGRVKAMLDENGDRIMKCGPSTPVEILGLDGLPPAGQSFEIAPNEKTARAMVDDWEDERTQSNRVSGVTLEDVHAKMESGEVAALDLIVKTDVQGSIDAIRSTLEGLRTDDTRVNLIHIATGSITESDVMLASASNAVIVGFRSEPQHGARAFANQEGVDVRYYDVIYNLIDDIKMALSGLLAPVVEDIVEGYATVRAIFQLGRGVRVAGIFVNDGRVTRRAEIHVTRSGRKLFAGQIASLKHFRDDVREVASGNEGGIVLEGFSDLLEGDVLESHISREVE